jgi:hypothetical protein
MDYVEFKLLYDALNSTAMILLKDRSGRISTNNPCHTLQKTAI